jgi:DnaJ domain
MRNRRYCSVECRQQLRRQLNLRTGLLRALNTRYATFYFTDALIVMELMLYNTRDIYNLIYPRSSKTKPADDFTRLSYKLANDWWDEKNRTNKRYLANRTVLDQAGINNSHGSGLRPIEIKKPARVSRPLIQLQLTETDLSVTRPQLEERIKQAFRRQAVQHHPDRGGSSADFRKIHAAYEDLIRWAQKPTFVRRRGFPDKWFYEAIYNRWVQPTPEWR